MAAGSSDGIDAATQEHKIGPPRQDEVLQPPLDLSGSGQDLSSSQNKDVRPKVLRSYSSNKELSAIESPNAAATSYASLGYAPRQKLSNGSISVRPSHASIEAHSSLWKQQKQSNTSHDEMRAEASSALPSSAPIAPKPNSLSSASTSMPAIEGSSVIQPSEKRNSSQDKLSAAEALAKQQLRADVESLGVRIGSIGWALLERLQSAHTREWKDLNVLLSSGRAALLLPVTPLVGREVTLSQAYNHVVFSTVSSEQPLLFTSSVKGKEKEQHSLLTLKGLRTDLIDDTLQGDLHLEMKSFVPREDLGFVLELRADTKRPDLIKTLMPLPNWEAGEPSSRIKMLAYSSSLLLPPTLFRKREASNGPDRPRTSSTSSIAFSDQQVGSRASGTFATLFGGRRDRKSTLGDEGKELKSVSKPSDSEALSSNIDQPIPDESLQVAQPTRSIAVAVIDREIRRAQILDEIGKSMQERIRLRLQHDSTELSLPDNVVEVICSFAAIFVPPSSSAQSVSRSFARSASTDTDLSKSPGIAPMSAPFLSSPDELAESFQDFYASIKDQLEELKIETINQQLPRIEEAVCGEVYDRIFCPFTSPDRFHDEALRIRITALNEMGIDLSHLGLALPEEGTDERRLILDGIGDIVAQCGSVLESLDDRRGHAPARKLAIMVSAHKIIVEGLARLPKIEMIDDVEKKEANVTKEETEDSDAGMRVEIAGHQDTKATEKTAPSSGADLVLPLLLYCIICLNPPTLASNLLYIQRFHAESLVQGEASYCLVNVQAAVAFLENLEPASLGLVSTSKLTTANDLEQESRKQDAGNASNYGNVNSNTVSMPMRMRSKVAHDVGELAGMSNRVITGVLGSSLGAFGRMMGAGTTFAMGIEAESNKIKRPNEATKQRSIDDVRTLLTGRDAIKPSAAEDKVVAIEIKGNEQASILTKSAITTRPSAGTRSSSVSSLTRPPTDYSRDRAMLSPLSSSTKARISDRLASIPTLNRTNSSASANDTTLPVARSEDLAFADGEVERVTDIDSPSTIVDHSLETSTNTILATDDSESFSTAHIPASLQSPYPPSSSPPTPGRPLHVVLASTGSVASVKVPLMVWKLLQYDNVLVQVISTKSSRHFYNVEALSNSAAANSAPDKEPYSVSNLAHANAHPLEESSSFTTPRLHVWSDEDEWTQWSKIGDPILHIELRRWADVVLIAPCSANTLAKINAGICDDLLTSFLRALSPSTPTYLFPAMNTLMYMHPLTARHLAFAREVLKYHIVGPIEKRLACGDLGQGAMQEWSDIVDLVVQRYALEKSKGGQAGDVIVAS